jgi:hypothetical protein
MAHALDDGMSARVSATIDSASSQSRRAQARSWFDAPLLRRRGLALRKKSTSP